MSRPSKLTTSVNLITDIGIKIEIFVSSIMPHATTYLITFYHDFSWNKDFFFLFIHFAFVPVIAISAEINICLGVWEFPEKFVRVFVDDCIVDHDCLSSIISCDLHISQKKVSVIFEIYCIPDLLDINGDVTTPIYISVILYKQWLRLILHNKVK